VHIQSAHTLVETARALIVATRHACSRVVDELEITRFSPNHKIHIPVIVQIHKRGVTAGSHIGDPIKRVERTISSRVVCMGCVARILVVVVEITHGSPNHKIHIPIIVRIHKRGETVVSHIGDPIKRVERTLSPLKAMHFPIA
jgi:hypothetical protein